MAGRSAGELWFEMGVRDKVKNALAEDLKAAGLLQRTFDGLTRSWDNLSKSQQKAARSALGAVNTYQNALIKINEVKDRLSRAIGTSKSLGLDTTELERYKRSLSNIQGSITRVANAHGAGSIQTENRINSLFEHRLKRIIEVTSAQEKLNRATEREGVAAIQAQIKANQGLMSSYDKVTRSTRQTMSTLSMLRQQAGYYFSLFGAQTLLRNIITIGGQFEYQHVALQNIIGDAEKATVIFSQLKDLAIESPKTFMELTTAAKQLSAYQIPANELFETTKRLSDLSVGLGVDINRLILAYGQVRSAAVLRGQELRQFTEAGIPIVQALADKFTQMNGKLTTTADVFKLISQRAVPFEMVRDILWEMTNEGGRFYDMQAVMADTLYGKWQKLADIWQITLGDIADANSASGKFFKTALDGVIFLARNLQTIVPMLSSFAVGKMFGGKLENALGYLGSVDANIAKAQKLHMIEQRRRLAEGEITAEQYKQNIALSQQRNNYYALLAVSGRLNAIQISRLVAQGKINNQVLRELVMTNQLSSRLAAVMRLDRMRGGSGGLLSLLAGGGAGALLKSGAGSLLGGLKSLMGGWVGIGLTAVGALMSYNMKINREIEEARQRTENVKSSAIEMANAVNGALGESAKSSDDLGKKVEYLEEQLESAGDQGKRIISEANGIDDLAERFSYLTRAATAYRDVLEHLSTDSGSSNISAAIHAAGFDDEDNSIANYEKSISSLSKIKGKMANFSSYYQKMVDTMVAKYKELDAALGDKNLFEKVEYLFTNRKYAGSADAILRSMGQSGLLALTGEFTQSLRAVEESFNSVGRDAMKSLDSLKAEALENGIDVSNRYSELTDAEKTKLQTIVTKYLEGLTNASEDTKNRIGNWLAQGLHANLELTPIIKSVKLEGYSKDVWEQFGGAMLDPNDPKAAITIGNTKFTRQQVANTFESPTKFESRIKAEYKSAEENLEALKKSKIASKEALAEAQDIRDEKLSIWNALRTDSINDKKNTGSRGVGGVKKDSVLEAWKLRVDALKEFYAEWSSLRKEMGKAGAYNEIFKSGIMPDMFDANGKPKYNLDNYVEELGKINDALAGNTDARKKAKQNLKKEQFKEVTDRARQAAEEAMAELQHTIEQTTRKWDLYKEISDKTGNKENAMQLVFGNTANLRNGINSAKEYWKSMLEDVAQGVNPDDLNRMSDSALADKFGENWKTVKAYRDEYMKAFRASADEEEKIYLELLEASMTFADKMAKIESERAKDIAAAKGDQNLIYAANQKANKAISEINLEQLKDTINWDVVFGNLETYTKDVLVKVRQQLKDYLKLNRKNMDVKQIKTVTDAVNKLNDAIADQSGLFGGIREARENLTEAINNEKDAQIEYNFAVMRYGKESQQAYDALMRLKAAQGEVTVAYGNLQGQQQSTMGKITQVTNAITNLGKTSKASLSDVGNAVGTIVDALSKSGSGYGQLIAAIFSLLDAIGSQGLDGFLGNILSSVGSAVGGIVKGVGNIIGGIFGDSHAFDFLTDFWDGNWRYEKAKQEYEGLISTWEKITDAKAKYFEEGWGNEARNAAKEAKELLDAQIEATRIIARERLNSGDNLSAHSIWYRMWQGSYGYGGQNWKDVAKEAEKGMKAAGLGDVTFESMEDMTRMTADQLEYLMTNYTGLWANMDDDFKEYLEKLIEYYRNADEQLEKLKEKITGWNFKSLSDSWANALSNMKNSATNLYEDFEDGLREAIINAMVSNIYSDEMKGLVDGLADAAQNELYTDVAGNVKQHTYDNEGKILDTDVLSEYTQEEYKNMRAVAENLAEREAASRDLLADLFGWEDKESGESSVSQVLSGLTEDEQGLFMAYVNAIRGDVSIIRMHWDELYAAIAAFPAMGAVAQMQLQQLEAIAANTLRNADSAAVIEGFCRRLELGEVQIKVK